MTDVTERSDPSQYDDVNETVAAEWEAETTPYERVRTVIARTYTPVSAETVGDRARTSAKTARKHLQALVTEGFVVTEPAEYGATHYRRSPESVVLEQAADILAETSRSELKTRVTEMRRRLGKFRDTYGVESPEELAVVQTNDELAGHESRENIDDETIGEWRQTRQNLAFANAALAIANAREFVGGKHADENRSLS